MTVAAPSRGDLLGDRRLRADAAYLLPAATVTQIATAYGFWELGRFSLKCRALFGKAPSMTLRRPSAER